MNFSRSDRQLEPAAPPSSSPALGGFTGNSYDGVSALLAFFDVELNALSSVGTYSVEELFVVWLKSSFSRYSRWALSSSASATI